MPFLILQKNTTEEPAWEIVEINSQLSVRVDQGGTLRLETDSKRDGTSGEADAFPGIRLVSCIEGSKKRFVLISRGKVLVNGRKIPGNMRVLKDKDEITILNNRVYFSGQCVVKTEVFKPHTPAHRHLNCPVCGDTITEGQTAVRCPQCQILYHQDEGRACWSSSPRCATYGCGLSTRLDGQQLWIPDDHVSAHTR